MKGYVFLNLNDRTFRTFLKEQDLELFLGKWVKEMIQMNNCVIGENYEIITIDFDENKEQRL